MKRHSMPVVREGGVNVTPLIDIVMCLIIFFMLVAKIGVTTGAVKMDHLVESLLGAKIDDMGNTITLNVQKAPNNVDPVISALVHDQLTPLDHKELVAVLKECRRANADWQVILRAESDVPYMMIQPVLMGCAEAGILKIDFNTKIPEGVTQ